MIYALSSSLEPDRIRYIGKTVRTLRQRIAAHIREARYYKHNRRCIWIRSVLSNGGTLLAHILELSPPDDNGAEKQWITKYRADIVNGTSGGDGGDTFSGRHHTEETKNRIRDANTGKPRSAEWCAAISKSKRGKRVQLTPEASLAKSLAITARNKDLQHRAKVSAALKGRKFSEEWRQKISEAAKRRCLSFPRRDDGTFIIKGAK